MSEKKYVCSVCKASFETAEDLIEHSKGAHPSGGICENEKPRFAMEHLTEAGTLSPQSYEYILRAYLSLSLLPLSPQTAQASLLYLCYLTR